MRATPALAARAQVCEHPALARSASATSLLAPDRRSQPHIVYVYPPSEQRARPNAFLRNCKSRVARLSNAAAAWFGFAIGRKLLLSLRSIEIYVWLLNPGLYKRGRGEPTA